VETDNNGRLLDVRLEHGDLPEAFEAMGLTGDASASAALRGRPAETVAPELAALLTRLLSSAARPPTTLSVCAATLPTSR
jgi:hypothetical protein